MSTPTQAPIETPPIITPAPARRWFKKKRYGGNMKRSSIVGAVILAVLAIAGCGGGLIPTTSHTVTYAVTDSSGSGATSVTFMSGGGITQRSGATLPFSEDATMSSGQPLVMNAQRAGSDSGTITCTISVDGAQVQTSDGSGPYALCQASTVL
jgi:hypothetical protein